MVNDTGATVLAGASAAGSGLDTFYANIGGILQLGIDCTGTYTNVTGLDVPNGFVGQFTRIA